MKTIRHPMPISLFHTHICFGIQEYPHTSTYIHIHAYTPHTHTPVERKEKGKNKAGERDIEKEFK